MSDFIQSVVITGATPCTLTAREKLIYQGFSSEELDRHYNHLFQQLVFVAQQRVLWRQFDTELKSLSPAARAEDIKHLENQLKKGECYFGK